MIGAFGTDEGRWRRLAPPVLALVAYSVLSAFVYGAHSPFSSTTLPPCGCNDLALQTWFLEWPAYAITHGHSPLYTSWAAFPDGVNLMDNTGAPLLGVLFAPVTLTLGPIAALSFAMRLAFAVSAISMCLVLRRWTRWWPAAFFGGLVYAFSPFVVAQAQSHVFLTFVPLPPITVALLDELVVHRRHLARNGCLLGAVLTAQLLISPEILGMCGVAIIASLVVMAARHPVAAWQRAAGLAKGLGTAAISFAVLAAYPIWAYLYGPYHVAGPQHQLSQLEAYHGSVGSLFYPTSLERFGTASMLATGNSLVQGNGVEHATYIGLPLLVILAFITFRCRRVGRVTLFGLVALGAWSVTLGTVLYTGLGGHPSIPMPYNLLKRLPLVNAGLDLRYSFVMYLAVSVVLAVGLDLARYGAWPRLAAWRPPWLRGAYGRSAGCLGVAIVGLLPLVPNLPYASTEVGVPAIFTAKTSPLTSGASVLTYPLPVGYEGSIDQSLLWQAEAHMRFKMVGFRGALAGKHHHRLAGAAVLLPPTAAEDVLVWGLYGQPAPPPPNDAITAREIRMFLTRYRVDDVVVVPWGPRTQQVVAYYTKALGAPTMFGTSYFWSSTAARALRSMIPPERPSPGR